MGSTRKRNPQVTFWEVDRQPTSGGASAYRSPSRMIRCPQEIRRQCQDAEDWHTRMHLRYIGAMICPLNRYIADWRLSCAGIEIDGKFIATCTPFEIGEARRRGKSLACRPHCVPAWEKLYWTTSGPCAVASLMVLTIHAGHCAALHRCQFAWKENDRRTSRFFDTLFVAF